MANRKKKNKSLVNWRFVIIASIILSLAAIITMADFLSLPSFVPTWDEVGDTLDGIKNDIVSNYDLPVTNDKELQVHYIDVGQGDSILIRYDGKNALIDSGDTNATDEVMGYLNANSVSKIDVLIVSHPDSDHIGSMSEIIDNYDIGEIYMPPLSEDLVPTTNVYTNMLLSISQKGLKITLKEAGDKPIKFGDLEFECVAPEGEFASTNNSSLALRLVYGETSFLFTGDMEKTSEKSTLQKGHNVSADVLKVAHHGSSSSTTAKFLDAVTPEYAVISVGEGNRYKHPSEDVVKELSDRGIKIYRTDLDGDIVFISDGKQLDVRTQK